MEQPVLAKLFQSCNFLLAEDTPTASFAAKIQPSIPTALYPASFHCIIILYVTFPLCPSTSAILIIDCYVIRTLNCFKPENF